MYAKAFEKDANGVSEIFWSRLTLSQKHFHANIMGSNSLEAFWAACRISWVATGPTTVKTFHAKKSF